jgi:DNA polymerase elongation subunit (family B)
MQEVNLYSTALKYPTRASLLDPGEVAKSANRIKAGQPIAYVANYVKEYMLDASAGLQIMTFGHLTCGTKVGVLINGIKLYVDIMPMEIIKSDYDSEEKQCLLKMDREVVTDPVAAYQQIKNFPLFGSFALKVSDFARCTSSNEQEVIYKKVFNIGFQPTMVGYRVYYRNLKSLRNAVYENDNVKSAYMQPEFFVASYSNTSAADLVGSRQNKYFGSWMAIVKYTQSANEFKKFSKLEYNLVVNIADYVKVSEVEHGKLGITAKTLNIYKSVHFSVDIETADSGKQEDIRSENNNKGILSESNVVFNIGCIIGLEDNLGQPPLKVNIVHIAAPSSVVNRVYKRFAIPGQITIVTHNQRETLEAFIRLTKSIMPDFMYGYNSLDFDIPQIVIALRCNNLFDRFYQEVSLAKTDSDYSYKYNYKHNGIEYRHNSQGYTYWCNLSTTSAVSGISGSHKSKDVKLKLNNQKLPSIKIKTMMKLYHEFDIPGIVMLDVMLISWKQYPNDNAKGGMNYYLAKNKLPLKLDVPYYKIWLFYAMSADYDIEAEPRKCKETSRYYLGHHEIGKAVYKALDGLSLIEQLRSIVEYCSYDAEAAMSLVKTYNFMNTKRKFCELVNLPLYKIIYRADGKKVENGLRRTLINNDCVFIEECLNHDSEDGFASAKIKKIKTANPNMLLYHIKQKAPRNTGGHVEIFYHGKVVAKFVVDGKTYEFNIPIDALDFASLYPSIMMAFNLCHTTIVFDIKIVEYVRKYRPDIVIHELPAILLVNESAFPEEMNQYFSRYYRVESFKDSIIYILQHSGDKSKYGIFPQNMGQFFTERGEAKKRMFKAEECANEIIDRRLEDPDFAILFEKHKAEGGKRNIKEFAEYYSANNDDDYVNYRIVKSNEDLGQLCVKITMNTVYGMLDYVDSCMYSPLAASIVTYYGRSFLKHSNDFCIANGRTPVYNDTDSTYYYHPLEMFQSTVERYVRGQISKDDFKRRMVYKSMKNSYSGAQLREFYTEKMANADPAKVERLKLKLAAVTDNQFADRINRSFAEKSKGNFLRQIREETLYPAAFCMLKKYFGLKHEKKYVANYSANDFVFRGIKIRVANTTPFEKKFIWDVICRIVDEDTDIREIVFDRLDKAFDTEINYSDLSNFECTARYKSKGGKADLAGMIQRFEQTRDYVDDPKLQYLLRTPFELENVNYVFVRNAEPYTITGLVNEPKKQDLNEYSEVVKYIHKKNSKLGLPFMEIDIMRYVAGTAATCAQLLTYDKSFGYTDNMIYKTYAGMIAKYIKKYCKNYYARITNREHVDEERKQYKKFIGKGAIFGQIVNAYAPEHYNTIMRMIPLSSKLKYFDKLSAITGAAHEEIGTFDINFIGDHVNQEYLDTTKNMMEATEKYFMAIKDFINITRERIVKQLFSYTKLAFQGLPYEVRPIDAELAAKLDYCEYLFIRYAGLCAIFNGITNIRGNEFMRSVDFEPNDKHGSAVL